MDNDKKLSFAKSRGAKEPPRGRSEDEPVQTQSQPTSFAPTSREQTSFQSAQTTVQPAEPTGQAAQEALDSLRKMITSGTMPVPPPLQPLPVADSTDSLYKATITGKATPASLKPLPALEIDLARVNPEALAADYKKRQLLVFAGAAIVFIGITAYAVALSLQIQSMYRICAWFLVIMPFSLMLLLQELSKRLAPTRPGLAQKLCTWLTFGSPMAKCHVASLYFDVGNYAAAEKILTKAVKAVQVKHLAQYINTHAFLAVARARIGAILQAKQLIGEALDASTSWKLGNPTPTAISCLATTYRFAAEIERIQSHDREALQLYMKALQEVLSLKSPPVDLLVASLWGVGHQFCMIGDYTQASAYLEKASAIADLIPDLSATLRTAVYADLGIAKLATSQPSAAMLLDKWQKLEQLPSSKGESPSVNRLMARLAVAHDQREEATHYYAAAITSSQTRQPSPSYEFAAIATEYSGYLQKIGRDGDASVLALQATQAKYSLDQNNFAVEEKKAKVSVNPQAKQLAVNKGRFPIVLLLVTIFYGWSIWTEGLRIADFRSWVWFIGFATVTALKLLAKYGPQSAGDSSGTLVMLLQHIPFARYIVPELSRLPQRTVIASGVVALAIVGLVKVSLVAPDTIPKSGLLPLEYERLGMRFAAAEEFNKSEECFSHLPVSVLQSAQFLKFKRNSCPVHAQTAEAIELNAKAVKLSLKDNAGAQKLWKECIAKYPDFEFPYLHLSSSIERLKLESLRKSLKKQKADSKPVATAGLSEETKVLIAEQTDYLSKALSISPTNQLALLAMIPLEVEQDKFDAANKHVEQLDEDLLKGSMREIVKMSATAAKRKAEKTP